MRVTRLLPLVSALVAMGVSAAAAQAPMDLEVARAASAGERPNVIIAYRAGSESRLRTYFEKDVIRGEFPNGMAVDLRSRSVRELAQHPDILNISINARVSGQQVSLPGGTSSSTQDIQNLRATLGITANQTGAGVGIAIIDSGVVPSPDLDASIRAFYDFTNGRQMPTTRNDQVRPWHARRRPHRRFRRAIRRQVRRRRAWRQTHDYQGARRAGTREHERCHPGA